MLTLLAVVVWNPRFHRLCRCICRPSFIPCLLEVGFSWPVSGFCQEQALLVRKRAQLFRVPQQSRDTVLTNGIPALKTDSVFDGCVVCHRPQSLDFACCFSHPYRSLALYFIRPEDGLRLLRCLRAPLRRAILLICLFRERDANDSGTGVGSNGGADLVE